MMTLHQEQCSKVGLSERSCGLPGTWGHFAAALPQSCSLTAGALSASAGEKKKKTEQGADEQKQETVGKADWIPGTLLWMTRKN